ncbi:MAG: hypothetical protein LUC22_05635, partial [Prevotella sp.]|nr:hypothetical protein [Prevotella sp.]
MKLSVRLLTCLFFIPVVISVLIVVCFECGWFLPGALYLPDNPRPEFVVTVVMELLTLCVIPVALRLFRFKRIKNALAGKPEWLLR